MDLDRDEAERLFPEDRGSPVTDADVEPYLSIARDEYGWVVETDDGRWTFSGHEEADVLSELARRYGVNTEEVCLWDLFVDVESTIDVLDAVTNRNP